MTLFNTITPETQKLIDDHSDLINEKLKDWIESELLIRKGIAVDVMKILTLTKRQKNPNQRTITLSPSRTKMINKLVNQGVRLAQFEGVIKYKVEKDWGGPMQEYLRPETLFAEENFYKYLDEAREQWKSNQYKRESRVQDGFVFDINKATA